jgi:hypothetical protein
MQNQEVTPLDEAREATVTTAALAGPSLQAAATAAPPEAENEDDERVDGLEGRESNHEDEDDDEDMSDEEEEEEDDIDDKTCDHERRPKPKKPMPSLITLAERAILKQLTKAIDGRRVTARYCCGGRVRSLPHPGSPFADEKARKVPRLTMRWDDPEDHRGRKIQFLQNSSPSGSRTKLDTQIETLADRCEATGSLDDSRFSINFDPHFYGIIDVIAQILLPGFETGLLRGAPENRGVQAKLSNLQVSLAFCRGD